MVRLCMCVSMHACAYKHAIDLDLTVLIRLRIMVNKLKKMSPKV